MASSRSRRNGNPDQDLNVPLTQPPPTPLRGTRFQASQSTQTPSHTYGHFPAAPETYPLGAPKAILLPEPTPVLEYPAYDDPNPFISLNSPSSSPSNKRTANSTQLEPPPPPKKRQKKGKKGTTSASVADSLRGIAPPPLIEHPTSTPVEPEPVYFGSVLRADPEGSKKIHPTLWMHVYKLSEKIPAQSVLDPVSGEPVLKAKPTNSAYVACRPCLTTGGICKAWKNDGGVLSNIKRHFEEVHRKLFVISYPQDPIKQESSASSATGPFDVDVFVEKMVTWIVADDMPLRVVESDNFRAMIKSLNPTVSDKDIPRRTTVRDRILSRYKHEREKLRQELARSLGRISLTSDLWTDSNSASHMAVTAHWIGRTPEGGLEMKTALAGFRWVKDKHSGDNIATHFMDILNELDITHKIGGITMDNASNNNTAMDSLEQSLTARGITFRAKHQRIRCFAHIINLAVGDALTALPKPEGFKHFPDAALKTLWVNGQADTGYTKALQSNLVLRIQEIVKQLRSSGQRREAFRQTIIDGNHTKHFQVEIPCLQLTRNVVTRWGSTFQMIDRFLLLLPAINLFVENPNPAGMSRDDTLTVKETSVVNDIRTLFGYFNMAQQALSGELTPTLPFTLGMFDDLVSILRSVYASLPNLMHAIYASLEKLEKYREECHHSHLYVLAMVLHPGIKLTWLQGVWNEADINKAREITLTAMDLYSQPDRTAKLLGARGASVASTSNPSEQNLNRHVNSLRTMRVNLNLHQRATTPQSESRGSTPEPQSAEEKQRLAEEASKIAAEKELDKYLTEPLDESATDATSCDILSYWNEREDKFPRLFELAMTVLAIPATSVPSERVFSSSGRTDTAARNRMAPVVMEALQFLKFRYRKRKLDFSSGVRDDPEDLEAVTIDELGAGEGAEEVRW